jgi:acyl-CoA synthetase (NDP forming)
LADQLVASVRESGVPFFRSPERAMRAMRHLVDHHRALANVERTDHPAPPTPVLPSSRLTGHGTLAEYQGKAWLAELGLPVPQGGLARTANDALSIARRIGYPVVLKAQAAALPHKSDVGGVAIQLADDAALRTAWTQMQASIAKARPELTLDGLLVERMGPRGVEMVLGARRDAQWGPVLLLGLGGVWIEVLKDTRLMPADWSVEAITGEIRKLRAAALLQGARGAPPADIDALAAAAALVGAAMQAEPRLLEIDINPLVVYPQGQGVLALDALLVLADE